MARPIPGSTRYNLHMDFPPGPRMPSLLQAAFVTASPYGWMVKRWRRYGDVFSSRFPIFGRVVYVADPALVKQVFTGDPTTFHAGEANTLALGDALGDHSLLTLDEDRHLSQRKLLLPPFHGERVRRYIEVMAEATEREVATWPVGKVIELRPRMQAITLEVILRAVFGVRDDARMDLFRERIPPLGETTSVLNWLPFMERDLGGITPAARFRRALAAVDELIYAEIADRRAAGDAEDRDDVLSLLLSARHEDGSPMTDTELRDELMTLLTAGHETTATGLAWAFERLMRTPRVLERLTSSLDDDAYLDAVVKETLRVRPVVVDVARKLTSEIEIAGWRLPAGTLVLPAIAVMHARPDLYDSPEEYRPERFLKGERGLAGTARSQARTAESYAWIPFGGGVRRCIGASFAQVEMRTVLREVLRRVRLRAPTTRPERGVIRHVTVVPGRGARAVVEENRMLAGTARSQVGLAVEPAAELAGAHDGAAGVADAPSEVRVRAHD
jgi:cytochrome P450